MAWGAVAGAAVGVIGNAMLNDGGGSSSAASGQVAQSTKYYDTMADIGKEQWDLYKQEAVPLLRSLASRASTQDRTAEEIALAAGDVKDAAATGRSSLRRALEVSGRNPGDPGYGSLLAPSYMDEAAKVSAAVTDARRRERARVEDTNWGRAIQTVGAYQGLPQQANANLSGAAAGGSRNAQALTNLAGLEDARAAQTAYGMSNLASRLVKFGRDAQTTPPYSPTENTVNFQSYQPMDTYDYAGQNYGEYLYPGSFRDGGAVRRPLRHRTLYADGGTVTEQELSMVGLTPEQIAHLMSGAPATPEIANTIAQFVAQHTGDVGGGAPGATAGGIGPGGVAGQGDATGGTGVADSPAGVVGGLGGLAVAVANAVANGEIGADAVASEAAGNAAVAAANDANPGIGNDAQPAEGGNTAANAAADAAAAAAAAEGGVADGGGPASGTSGEGDGSSGAGGDGGGDGGYRNGGAIGCRPGARRYAQGGAIKGPGTGTSDDVPTRKRPGTFILSADVTRAVGTRKLEKLMEDAGVRPGYGEHPDDRGVPIRTSNGEWAMPPEVVQHHGEEFFRALQRKYHRPVASEESSMANGGVIRKRGLPSSVEEAIFREMPARALGNRRG